MLDVTFEWNSKKAADNRRKHGVAFEEAQSAFLDENARVMPDPDHSQEEDRFLLLGLSVRLRILVVSHCYRGDDKIVRLISARKADRSERSQYAKFLP